MLISNERMLELMCVSFADRVKLPRKLARIISGGFVEYAGIYVFKSLNIQFNESLVNKYLEYYHDEIGAEVALNSISIEAHTTDFLMEVSYLLAFRIYKKWKASGFNKRARIIIMYDKKWSFVRFHVEREGRSWFSNNIDEYSNGLCIINM